MRDGILLFEWKRPAHPSAACSHAHAQQGMDGHRCKNTRTHARSPGKKRDVNTAVASWSQNVGITIRNDPLNGSFGEAHSSNDMPRHFREMYQLGADDGSVTTTTTNPTTKQITRHPLAANEMLMCANKTPTHACEQMPARNPITNRTRERALHIQSAAARCRRKPHHTNIQPAGFHSASSS